MEDSVSITIGAKVFFARLRHDLAPRSTMLLAQLLPYSGKLLQARWSGEAFWSPLGVVWPSGSILAGENATGDPAVGQVLLYAGKMSEPELFFPYGTNSFASKAGALKGNPVLTIESGLSELAQVGRQVFMQGAMDICIQIDAK